MLEKIQYLIEQVFKLKKENQKLKMEILSLTQKDKMNSLENIYPLV